MEIGTALDIKKALILIETELGITPQKIGSLINLASETSYKKLQEASKLWNEFDKADIIERGKMLEFTLTHTKKPVCTACSGSGRYCGRNCGACNGTGYETEL